ncbi:MAG TPA: glycosyltransferase [Burkholderiales bacterium]|nr:glycosyltransferase [Burkholderiales bacterium]
MKKQRERFPIVVHSHLRWDFVWQRPQQIFSRLARHHGVLFVEEPVHEAGEPRLRIIEAQAGVMRAIPVLPEPCGVDAACEAVLPLLQRALATHPLLADRFVQPVQWFYSPMCAPRMAGAFGDGAIVYDCMDELANFRFAPPDIAERERFLLGRADVVFTGGRALYEAKSRHHGNVHFFGCGVDATHFGAARVAATPVPAAVAGLPRPVLGYFGVIDERLDYGLVDALARAFSQGSIVMAGPLAKVTPEELPDRPNLHWLGQQPYEALPALVKGFDVCLMPFALNEATRYINPTKTLEYMAAGKPIVSTAVPDVVRNFGDFVRIADSLDGFVEQALEALAPDPARIAAGIERANGATWDAIVAAMRRHVLHAVNGRLSLAAA